MSDKKLTICTGVCGNNPITRRWIDETIANCEDPHQLCVMENGMAFDEAEEIEEWLYDLEERGWSTDVNWSKDPVGSSRALNLAAELASEEIVAFVHNDLMILEKGWDRYLIDFFENTPDVGLVGFAGAKQLGALDIYKTPYVLTQLGRAHVYTSLEEWQPHGGHCVEPTKVAVLDGLTMCIRKQTFVELGGFDEKMIHHMYDNDICLRSLYAGYTNWVIPVTVNHISGQTANYPKYNEWLKTQGYDGDGEIHRLSHEYFYNKWTGKLPVFVQ